MSGKAARILELYTEALRMRSSPRTVETYLCQVRAYLAWLSERGVDLVEARREDLLAHQSALWTRRKRDGKPYSAQAQASRVKAIKSLYRFLHRRSYVLSDLASVLELPRREQRLPRVVLSKQEVSRILAAPRGRGPRDVRDRAVLETLYGTGIRATELCSLRVEDVDTEERTLRVVQGKGRKDRHVPLTRAAARAIERYLARARAVFVGPRPRPHLFLGTRGKPLVRFTLGQIVTRWARAARMKKRVTCHVFRHTYATHLLKGGADIRHIQVLLGHRSIVSTERYTKVEMSDLRRVIERSHPRGR